MANCKICNIPIKNKRKTCSNQCAVIYKYGELKNFTVTCYHPECNNQFNVEEREKSFPKKDKYFCSKYCSHSFVTYNKRDQINKQVSEKLKTRIKKDYYCQSCNILLNKNKNYCDICVKLIQNKRLFNLLNIKNQNLKIANQKAINLIKYYYFELNWSAKIIANYLNLYHKTIYSFFRKNNIERRSLNGAQSLSLKEGRSELPSNNMYNNGYHITWNNKKVYYRSLYELEYAQYLDKYQIDYDMEALKIKYYDSQRKKERIAIPDFYLPEYNLIVEVKSTWTLNKQNMRDKIKIYKKQGYNFNLVLNKREFKINAPIV